MSIINDTNMNVIVINGTSENFYLMASKNFNSIQLMILCKLFLLQITKMMSKSEKIKSNFKKTNTVSPNWYTDH